MELWGWEVKQSKKDLESEEIPSIIAPGEMDGSIEVAPGGAYGTYVDLEGKVKTESELVTKYRSMSHQPECDQAIQDIVNEAIVMSDIEPPIAINLDESNLSKGIKNKIMDEFKEVLKLLDFQNDAYDIFRRWYIDGRLYYNIVIDPKNPKAGIKDLRYIDPRKIRKIRETVKEKDRRTGAVLHKGLKEYFMYNPAGAASKQQSSTSGVKIAKDAICYVHSGILDTSNKFVYSNLHKAIKPMNQLVMLEDAVVIYRISRAPERRIFYIDVGNLPKMKAEQYLRDMMNKHKNKLVYNAQTGEVKDSRKFMTMLEDYWIPRREGGRGTEISTLPPGQNLGEMDDVDYFRRKLYKALNVPITRMETENQFNLGRGSEITRDEVKFSKFINRLRNRFSILFNEILEKQLVLKGITSKAEWKEYKQAVYYDFNQDNHYAEVKEMEMLRERFQLMGEVENYVGDYLSKEWVKDKILRFDDEEKKLIEKQKKKEEAEGEFDDEEEEKEPPEQKPIPVTLAPESPPKDDKPNKDDKTKKEEASPEDKALVESMTAFMDSMTES